MSTLENPRDTLPAPRQPAAPAQFTRTITAEWTKLTSVRSTVFAVLAAGAMCVGFAVLLGYGTVSRWDTMSPQQQASFQPATFSVSGVLFAQLVIGSLGVLAISAEYSTGTIRATLSATPQRLLAYLAKITVFITAALAVSLPTSLVAFFAAQQILAQKNIQTTLGSPDVPRVVLGAALFLVAVGLLGLGLGTLLRHTAAAISTLFGLMLVLPILSNFLPSDWALTIDKWLPLNAGQAVMRIRQDPNQFAPWTGLGVLYAYALIALVAGAIALRRRDA